jgi:predicted DNA-binding protein
MSRKAKKHVVPLIVPDDMQQKLDALKAKSGLSKADLMRLAMERGIGAVEKMFEQPETAAA